MFVYRSLPEEHPFYNLDRRAFLIITNFILTGCYISKLYLHTYSKNIKASWSEYIFDGKMVDFSTCQYCAKI